MLVVDAAVAMAGGAVSNSFGPDKECIIASRMELVELGSRWR